MEYSENTGFNVSVNATDDYDPINIYDLVDQRLLTTYKVIMYYVPVIFGALSLIGNGLLFLVLSRPHNRQATTSLFLMALAVADLSVSIRNVIFWLDVRFGVTLNCNFIAFMEQASMTLSSWLLAAISFERVLSVTLPLKVKEICKPVGVKIIIASMIVLFCGYGTVYGILFTEMRKLPSNVYLCVVPEKHNEFYAMYMRWISQMLHSVFPLLIIFVNSVIIVTALFRRIKSKTANKVGRSITINIILINLAFIITRFPSNFLYLNQVVTEGSRTLLEEVHLAIILECLYQLRDLNSVLNFYIYFLAGSKFRQDTKGLLLKIFWCRIKRTN